MCVCVCVSVWTYKLRLAGTKFKVKDLLRVVADADHTGIDVGWDHTWCLQCADWANLWLHFHAERIIVACTKKNNNEKRYEGVKQKKANQKVSVRYAIALVSFGVPRLPNPLLQTRRCVRERTVSPTAAATKMATIDDRSAPSNTQPFFSSMLCFKKRVPAIISSNSRRSIPVAWSI